MGGARRRDALALLALLGAALTHAAGPCERRSCRECLGPATAGPSTECKWCYASQRCAEIDAADDDSSCHEFVTHPAVCPCEPWVVNECRSCVSKIDCVWVQTGTMNTTTKLAAGFELTRSRSWDGVCWSGSIFSGPTNAADELGWSEAYRRWVRREADVWFWGQCALQNGAFGWTLLVFGVGGGFGACLLFRALKPPSADEQTAVMLEPTGAAGLAGAATLIPGSPNWTPNAARAQLL